MLDLTLKLQQHAPINIQFEQLVAVQSVADAQKDILIQALRLTFPSIEYFTEANAGATPTAAAHQQIQIIILQL